MLCGTLLELTLQLPVCVKGPYDGLIYKLPDSAACANKVGLLLLDSEQQIRFKRLKYFLKPHPSVRPEARERHLPAAGAEDTLA